MHMSGKLESSQASHEREAPTSGAETLRLIHPAPLIIDKIIVPAWSAKLRYFQYGVCRVSILGITMMVSDRYLCLDPQGEVPGVEVGVAGQPEASATAPPARRRRRVRWPS